MVYQAQASLSAHGEYINSKLSALNKFSARLEAALRWSGECVARLTAAAALPPPQRRRVTDSVAVSNTTLQQYFVYTEVFIRIFS